MNVCPYAEGAGNTQYRCPILQKRCPFQHWCPPSQQYKLTATAAKCSVKVKQDKK